MLQEADAYSTHIDTHTHILGWAWLSNLLAKNGRGKGRSDNFTLEKADKQYFNQVMKFNIPKDICVYITYSLIQCAEKGM